MTGRISAQEFPFVEFGNAFVAFLFAASAPVAIVLGAGAAGELPPEILASWIFAAFACNGVLTVILSVRFRQPLGFFWTIPGTVLVGDALDHFSFAEVIGAYLLTGLLLIGLGVTGGVRAIMDRIPLPIVLGMVAGVFVDFGLAWLRAFGAEPLLAAAMTAVFFALSASTFSQKLMPPLIGAMLAGFTVIVAQGQVPSLEIGASTGVFASPVFHVPAFSWAATVELVLPLTITVLAAQNAQGIAILRTAGHNPPTNVVTTACGTVSVLTAWLGCVSTCLAGPSNSILVSGGKPERHWLAAVIMGVLALAFSIYAPLATGLLLATPPAFMAALAGLAMLRVLQGAFSTAFGARFTLGALVSFLVTLSGVPVLGIGTPFWGLVFGLVTSVLLERGDFEVKR